MRLRLAALLLYVHKNSSSRVLRAYCDTLPPLEEYTDGAWGGWTEKELQQLEPECFRVRAPSIIVPSCCYMICSLWDCSPRGYHTPSEQRQKGLCYL
jgi:hypothetical protein